MKLLLDECLPIDFRHHFSDHEAHTAEWAGFKGKKNGELLSAAEMAGYDALLTVDQGIPPQFDRSTKKLSIIVIRSRTNQIEDLLPLVVSILNALESIRRGEMISVWRRLEVNISTRVIRTKTEHQRALREIEKLMSRPRLSREEREVYELLMQLTGDYESKTFPRQRSTPVELIEFLLEQNGQPQKVLAPIFGGETHVSEVLHGKRTIRIPQAVKLGKHFNVDPVVFLELR